MLINRLHDPKKSEVIYHYCSAETFLNVVTQEWYADDEPAIRRVLFFKVFDTLCLAGGESLPLRHHSTLRFQ
jgi:hypothetical protein